MEFINHSTGWQSIKFGKAIFVIAMLFIILSICYIAYNAIRSRACCINKIISDPKAILIGCFLLCIYIPGLPLQNNSGNINAEEKRIAAEKPVFSLEGLREYPRQFEKFYNDSFPMRKTLIDFYGNIKYYILHDNYTADTLVGKRGWIFYSQTLNDYKNFDLYSDEFLLDLKTKLQAARNLAHEEGAEFYVVFGPNKNEIYPEFMPTRIKKNEDYNRLEIVEQALLSGNIKCIPVRRALLNQKANYLELYSPTGTHWNSVGAYFAYQEIAERVQKDFPQITILSIDDLQKTVNNGYISDDATYAKKREWGDYTKVYEFNWSPKKNSYAIVEAPECPSDYIGKNPLIRTVSKAQNDIKMMVIRDSFSIQLLPYISDTVSEAVYYWQSDVRQSDIAFEKPDVVLFEIVQRHIPLI